MKARLLKFLRFGLSLYAGMTVRAFWIWVGIFIGAMLAQAPALAKSFVGLASAYAGTF
jgi:hypothetical protein